ncbi:MAG: hypothetical protein WCL51_08415 [Bacteroidota bacterium]
MTRLFITTFLIIINISVFGQRKIFEQENTKLQYYTSNLDNEVDSFIKFPIGIQQRTIKFFENSMTDFVQNIHFTTGYIKDNEILDSNIIEKNNNTIKDSLNEFVSKLDSIKDSIKYTLCYTLSDTTINIKKYEFILCFNEDEQLIYYGWPEKGYNKRQDFVNFEKKRKKAFKIARQKRYKTNICKYNFGLNLNEDKIGWHFEFVQNEENYRKAIYSNELNVIVIDAKSLDVIEEYIIGMNSID